MPLRAPTAQPPVQDGSLVESDPHVTKLSLCTPRYHPFIPAYNTHFLKQRCEMAREMDS